MILFNIGSDVLSVGELTNRGYYLGSNVSYNVKRWSRTATWCRSVRRTIGVPSM